MSMSDSHHTPNNERSLIRSSKDLKSITLYVWVDNSVRHCLPKTYSSTTPLTILTVTFSGAHQSTLKHLRSKRSWFEQLVVAELSNLTTIAPTRLLSELEVEFTLDPQNDTIIYADLRVRMSSSMRQHSWLTKLLERQSNQSRLLEGKGSSSSVHLKDGTSFTTYSN